MTVLFTALALASITASVFTVLAVVRDGYHRVPTRTF